MLKEKNFQTKQYFFFLIYISKIITIAHRLISIADYDKVAVMNEG